ncbi:MAG: sulfatase-like hydrolase/transferase [Candidatus Sumerlaeia bacterium]|nr:sulfatase-like hydrolase/transferase [Candidatus Sumerlaeia bacterium]
MNHHTSRRQFLGRTAASLAAATAAPSLAFAAASQPPQPNVVLILADDLGYGDIGCYGAPDIRTPAVDSLAAQGVRFTQFYANAPECTPTRTALLTGRYQQRVGGLECAIGINNVGRYDDAIRLAEKHELGLPAEETCIAHLLKDVGYTTALCGKWHLGYEEKFLPPRHGFDYSFGLLGGNIDYWFHVEPAGTYGLYENGKPVKRDGYLTDLITDAAVAFIRQAKNRPFFLYVPYNAPHTPSQTHDVRPDSPVTEENLNRGTREEYVKMVERMDEGIAAILKALDETGVADRTLVIFTSDNGAEKRGRNLPFSGAKSSLYEGGIRVPCVVRWPGVLPAGKTTDHIGITMDLASSIARAAGAKLPPGRTCDGVDVLDEVARNRPPKVRPLFWRYRRGTRTLCAVREGSLKYIRNTDEKITQEYLFDLATDPQEKNNLLTARPADVQRLKRLLADWEKEVQHTR